MNCGGWRSHACLLLLAACTAACTRRLPAHALLQHRLNIVHLVLRAEYLLLEAPQLQNHARHHAAAKPQPQAAPHITCSPISSVFRLKNASQSSVDFFTKYLRSKHERASRAPMLQHQHRAQRERCSHNPPRSNLHHRAFNVLQIAAHVKRRCQGHKHCGEGGRGCWGWAYCTRGATRGREEQSVCTLLSF